MNLKHNILALVVVGKANKKASWEQFEKQSKTLASSRVFASQC
jgi:hypothetical protein